MSDFDFPLHPLGYVRHWLVTSLRETPYQGPPGEENTLRQEALDPGCGVPPQDAALGAPGPFGQPWRFHYPGENFFVEHSAFYFRLTLVDIYACTELVSDHDGDVPARLWVAGAADLWVNGVHVTRFNPIRYMYPDPQALVLPLRKGTNVLCVRLQCLGVRDTRILFGLQLDRAGENLAVRLPGPDALRGPVVSASNWLDGVRTEGRDAVISSLPAPIDAEVIVPGNAPHPWSSGKTRLSLAMRPFQLSVAVSVSGQTLKRQFEIPANGTPSVAPDATGDFRGAQLEQIAAVSMSGAVPLRGVHCLPPLTARRLLGRTHPDDDAAFASAIRCIDQREDCADFGLAMLFRFLHLGLASPAESAEIKRAALGFRYWSDEPGSDAMCFWSENHSLLFHGCQRIAGLLFPEDIFTNSGLTGAEQAELALERCRKWLDHVEPRGFDEFLSGVYMPITVTALLNLVDYFGDAEVSQRAAGLIDQIYRDLATHAFRGVTVGPQGRVYRDVLYPEKSGTQALLAFASGEALSSGKEEAPSVRIGDWVVFVASSPTYRPPKELAELTRQPVTKRSRQADVEIVLHKTPDYLLTSLAIPASFSDRNEKGRLVGLQPGWGGYQQHIWQATLAPGCHVFVNHPGGSFDESKSRPGYWYGNGVLPYLVQREGVLAAIYSIPDGTKPNPRRTTAEWFWPIGGCPVPFDLHPIPFTHAHWPSDAFDEQKVNGHWAFGRKGSGYIALWCSGELHPHDDVLTGREWRVSSHRAAWLAICGNLDENGSFQNFMTSCLARQPVFDPAAMSLSLNDEIWAAYPQEPI